MKALVLHGVNLDMFGKRDPALYGTITLAEIDARLMALGRELEVDVETFQTNAEGAMCERIHAAHGDGTAAVVINAGAWTHYSYAIRDALAILSVPVVEVHMSNVHAREAFREISVFSEIATGRIAGFGVDSYLLGLRAAVSSAATKGRAGETRIQVLPGADAARSKARCALSSGNSSVTIRPGCTDPSSSREMVSAKSCGWS